MKKLYILLLHVIPIFSQSVIYDNLINENLFNDNFNNYSAGKTFSQVFDLKNINKLEQTSLETPNGFYLGSMSISSTGAARELYFSIPARQIVKLTLMTVMGQQVDEIIKNSLIAGTYKITYDASKLATGVYIYRLQTENYCEMKKMLVVK